MSAAAKPHIERLLARMDRLRHRAAAHRLLPGGRVSRFARDPDRPAGATEWPVDDPVTPAARLMLAGEPFEIDGDIYSVEDIYPSDTGPQANILILRGYEHSQGEERSTRSAIQVRDLETLIDEDRVNITFAGSARQFNVARGWCRGGRTIGSLGIALGSANHLDS